MDAWVQLFLGAGGFGLDAFDQLALGIQAPPALPRAVGGRSAGWQEVRDPAQPSQRSLPTTLHRAAASLAGRRPEEPVEPPASAESPAQEQDPLTRVWKTCVAIAVGDQVHEGCARGRLSVHTLLSCVHILRV